MKFRNFWVRVWKFCIFFQEYYAIGCIMLFHSDTNKWKTSLLSSQCTSMTRYASRLDEKCTSEQFFRDNAHDAFKSRALAAAFVAAISIFFRHFFMVFFNTSRDLVERMMTSLTEGTRDIAASRVRTPLSFYNLMKSSLYAIALEKLYQPQYVIYTALNKTTFLHSPIKFITQLLLISSTTILAKSIHIQQYKTTFVIHHHEAVQFENKI